MKIRPKQIENHLQELLQTCLEEIPIHSRILGYGAIAVGQSWYFINKFYLVYGCSSVWVLVQFIEGLVFRQIMGGFSLCFFFLVCNPISSLFLFPIKTLVIIES